MFELTGTAARLSAYYAALDAAVCRFVECGVTVDRMCFCTFKGSNRTDLLVDGVSRFSVDFRTGLERRP